MDRLDYLLLLNLLLLLAGLATLTIVVPKIVRRRCRIVGLPPASYAATAIWSVVAAIIVAVVGPILFLPFAGLTSVFGGICIAIGLPVVLLGVTWLSIWLASSVVAVNDPAFGRKTTWSVGVIIAVTVLANTVAAEFSLSRVRNLSARTISGANLKSVAVGLALYNEKHGEYPADLRTLATEGAVNWYHLLSWTSAPQADPGIKADKRAVDFVYIRPRADFPDDLVIVYEPPRFNDDEGGYVLTFDMKVRWLDADKLYAEVARTEKWIKDNPAPATQSSAD